MIHTVAELRQVISSYKQQGKIISLVPTMGNLHEGHLQLVDKAKVDNTLVHNTLACNTLARNTIVIVSVFVNPLQFGENEDLGKYPRTLDLDAKKLQTRGCDILFVPAVEDIYPASQHHGRDQTQVTVPGISEIFEGSSRPGHFTGVATIVSKLFNLIQPDQAVFGEKDYQQLQLIRQMVKDLCFPVEIIAVATVREENGLAMSSRNGFLSKKQRNQAALINQTLKQLAEKLLAGEENFAALEETAFKNLDQQGFTPDYVSIRSRNLQPATVESKELVILVAARLGTTRLIDNIQLQR
jgi:pantoate--beta-alanine ligase